MPATPRLGALSFSPAVVSVQPTSPRLGCYRRCRGNVGVKRYAPGGWYHPKQLVHGSTSRHCFLGRVGRHRVRSSRPDGGAAARVNSGGGLVSVDRSA